MTDLKPCPTALDRAIEYFEGQQEAWEHHKKGQHYNMALAAMYQAKESPRHSPITPEAQELIDLIDEGIRQAGLVTGQFQQDDKTLVAVEVGDLKTIRRALEGCL